MHVAAVATDGPLKDQELGLRYWILHQGAWTKADGMIQVGDTVTLTLTPWQSAIQSDRKLNQHLTFDTVEQEFTVPVFWVSGGKLSPTKVLP